VAGEWTADWAAARKLAADTGTFYIINFGKTSGCAYCAAAELGIWSQVEFQQWAKSNGIPLVYANRVSDTSEPGVSVNNTYPGLKYYPTLLLIDGKGTGKTLIKEIITRYGITYNGITIDLTPSTFIAIVNSYTKNLTSNADAWDATATAPGDETSLLATPLAMATTNQLHGAHSLKGSDTNDWFAITNLVAGQRYRIAVTNLVTASTVAQMSFYSNSWSAAHGAAWTNQPLPLMTNGFFFASPVSGTGYLQALRGGTNSASAVYTLSYRKTSMTPHALTVASGSGTAAAMLEGEDRSVTADAPGAGMFFSGWSVTPAGAPLGLLFDASKATTKVTMPDYAVTLTATYQAETRVLVLSGSLAFGNILTNRVSQKTLTIANSGNRSLTVTSIVCPDGFSASPTSFTVASGGSQSVTVTFSPVAVQSYSGDITVNSDKTSGSNVIPCSGQGLDNQTPIVTVHTPAGNPAMITEGATSAFSVSANDSTDPDTLTRGMVSITWFVDGVQKQVTTNGGPNAIVSTFTFKTDADTVQGVASNGVTVTAVALDKQGGVTETTWTQWVKNLQAAQTITFPALAVKALGDPDFAPGATVSSDLQVVYASANESVAQIVGNQIHIVGAGTAVITASQPGTADFKPAASLKQTLTVRVRVSATPAPALGGTVTGAGVYALGAKITLTAKPNAGYTFLHWENGLQTVSRSVVVASANLDTVATFGLTPDVAAPTLTNPGAQSAMVGVLFSLPLEITSDSLPTVKAINLPTGLRYESTSNAITGVPTVVASKTVTVTVKNANPTVVTQMFDIAVENLPTWAAGSFNGYCNHEILGGGVASLSVTTQGKVTGKLAMAGTNYTFSAASYVRRDGDGTLWIETQALAGKAVLPLLVKVSLPTVTDLTGLVPTTLSLAEGWFGDTADGTPDVTMYRNVWSDTGMTSVATNYAGYYTATLPVMDSSAGSGYLAFTVDKVGGVKSVGKLSDGSAVSLSSVLILDEAGAVWTVLYTSPTLYKGGAFYGAVEFVKPADNSAVFVRLLDGIALQWESRSPLATDTYGEGFLRDVGLSGGWYDRTGNLYTYYTNKTLSVSSDPSVAAPALFVGTDRYDSTWWSPDGVGLTAVTNTTGVLTGVKAAAAGTPAYVDGEWVYDAGTNTVGLTFGLTRATGLFSGTFKAWFDYGTTHTSKTITLQGALTPVRENMSSHEEGRGFFLSSDKSQYDTALKTVLYSFSNSYDFVIESAPQN